MSDDEIAALVDNLAAKSGFGGLDSSTMYGKFAMDCAKAAIDAERNRCATLADAADPEGQAQGSFEVLADKIRGRS